MSFKSNVSMCLISFMEDNILVFLLLYSAFFIFPLLIVVFSIRQYKFYILDKKSIKFEFREVFFCLS